MTWLIDPRSNDVIGAHDLPDEAVAHVQRWATFIGDVTGDPIEVRARGLSITISRRAQDGVLPEAGNVMRIAQLRHNPASDGWSLWCAGRDDRWQFYDDYVGQQPVGDMLRDIHDNPDRIFWS